jgi:hypothetical protein
MMISGIPTLLKCSLTASAGQQLTNCPSTDKEFVRTYKETVWCDIGKCYLSLWKLSGLSRALAELKSFSSGRTVNRIYVGLLQYCW